VNRTLLRVVLLAATAAVVALLALAGVLEWRDLSTAATTSAGEQTRLVANAVVDPAAGVVDGDVLRAAVGQTPAGAAGDMAVYLPQGRIVGAGHAALSDVDAVARAESAGRFSAAGGEVLLTPVRLAGGTVAVVEIFLPRWHVAAPWLGRMGVLVGGALVAVGLATLVGWWRTRPLVRSVRAVVAAAGTIGQGRTGVEVPGSEVAEVNQLIGTLNEIAARVEQLVASEREFVADLSHRLRTPLTALRLDSESIGVGPVAERVRHAVAALETDVDDLIRTAERVARVSSDSCDLAKVVRDRMAFWSTLAEHQGRGCRVECDVDEALVGLPEKDVGAVVDSLLGNVFGHTPAGTPFGATVVKYAGWVTLVVEDGGPGIADSEAALRRGASGRGSTGLGLDIARHAVETTGGTIHVDRGRLGGARIRLRFGEVGSRHDDPAPRAWRLWSRSAAGQTVGDQAVEPT
jgi:signal transduction histidine kinase